MKRLHNLGLKTVRLPLGATPSSHHVPILVSKSIETKSRVIVVFCETVQDLGIWAYRTVHKEGINIGSAVNFVTAALGNDGETGQVDGQRANGNDDEKPGIILTNPGQLIWHEKSQTAMNIRSWRALPRRYAVDPPKKMTFNNKIPRNYNWRDHITCVFEDVLTNLVSKNAKIDMIGVSEGGSIALQYLSEHCKYLLSSPDVFPRLTYD